MNDAERVIAKYERIAPIVIVAGVLAGFLIAGGEPLLAPLVLAIGVLLAVVRLYSMGWLAARLKGLFGRGS